MLLFFACRQWTQVFSCKCIFLKPSAYFFFIRISDCWWIISSFHEDGRCWRTALWKCQFLAALHSLLYSVAVEHCFLDCTTGNSGALIISSTSNIALFLVVIFSRGSLSWNVNCFFFGVIFVSRGNSVTHAKGLHCWYQVEGSFTEIISSVAESISLSRRSHHFRGARSLPHGG